MAATVTGLQVVDRLLPRRGIGLRVDADEIGSIAAGSVTSVFHFRRVDFSSLEFRNKGSRLWRPSNATGIADDVRAAGDLTASSGALANDANWADTTSEDMYLVHYKIEPAWVIEAMNLALHDVYFHAEGAVSYANDPDFQSTSTSIWTVSGATLTKISTADSANVFPTYIRSGRVANAAGNDYITQEFATPRGAEWFTGVLCRVDVGTFELVWRDVTNSAELGTAITTTEEAWVYVERRESVTSGSSGTETVGFRLQGDGATDDIYYNGAWFYPTDAKIITLNSTWDSSYKLTKLCYLTFDKQLATGVYDARSMRKHEIPQDDWGFTPHRAGANPNAIHFYNNSWLRYPILIEGRRAHADTDGPFTRVLTETTSCDIDLFEAATARRLFQDKRVQTVMAEHQQDWQASLAEAQRDYVEYSVQFMPKGEGPAKRVRDYFYSGLRS